jgi:NADP-dependent 3-hydroxy acid dehydrogenase YdfG
MSARSILITGASSGIGEALALAYATGDTTLHLGGRDPERLEAVAAACRTRGAKVRSAALDIADRQAAESWVTSADDAAPLDLVIANAGISGGSGSGVERVETMRRIMDVNVTGVLNSISIPLQRMASRQQGQIALMSSIAGYRGLPSAPAYSASKAAVRALGSGLRRVYASRNVRINTICPGFVVSRITDTNDFRMPFLMPAEKAAGIIRRGLEADRAVIAFPWQMALAGWLIGALPEPLAGIAFRNMPAKSPDLG